MTSPTSSLRRAVSLAAVAGLAVFTVACSDDDDGGGGGTELPQTETGDDSGTEVPPPAGGEPVQPTEDGGADPGAGQGDEAGTTVGDDPPLSEDATEDVNAGTE